MKIIKIQNVNDKKRVLFFFKEVRTVEDSYPVRCTCCEAKFHFLQLHVP